MKNKPFNTFKSKLIFGKYSIKYLISKGSFGEVYFGTNIIDGKNYALKTEERSIEESVLKHECYVLLNLKGPGIPSVISYGVSGKYNILVENLLGKSIQDIWEAKKRKFNLKDTCVFAIQAISLLEYVHSKNYIHRDIKPSNFLVGNPDNSQLYLIDFGNARKYKSSKTGKHIRLIKRKKVFGSLIFLSTNAVNAIEQTRKDDLETLGYAIIYLYIGSLPWSSFKHKNLTQGVLKIREERKKISIEKICDGMPNEMNIYLNYVNNLKYEECPDYEYLRKLFWNVLKKIGENKLLFSWADRNISRKIIISRKRNRSPRDLCNELIKKCSNKDFLSASIKKNINKNDENSIYNTNKSYSFKIKEIKNKSLTENIILNHNKMNSKNKDKIIKENINNNNFKIENKQNNERINKTITIYKNKSNLNKNNINNINNKNIIILPKKKIGRNVENYGNEINLSNNEKEFLNNNFKNTNNYMKKEEKSFNKVKLRNFVNVKNININNNSNNYTYKAIINNYKSPKFNQSISLANSKLKYSQKQLIPSFYKSIFSNKYPIKTNLSEYGKKIDNHPTQIEILNTNQSEYMANKTIMKYSTYMKLDYKKNIYQKTNYIQPKFINKYALHLNNNPKNYI